MGGGQWLSLTILDLKDWMIRQPGEPWVKGFLMVKGPDDDRWERSADRNTLDDTHIHSSAALEQVQSTHGVARLHEPAVWTPPHSRGPACWVSSGPELPRLTLNS